MVTKNLQQKRMMRYFAEAYWKLVEKEGVEAVTARKVAELAGYNVATMYNYFENLNHLIFFASIKELKEYAIALPEWTNGIEHPIDLYLKVWECFNHHAFQKPHAYKYIFLGNYTKQYNNTLNLYYEVFPEELPTNGLRFYPMLESGDIHTRDYQSLMKATHEGFINEDDAWHISMLNTLIFKGMLEEFLSDSRTINAERAAIATTKFQAHVLRGYGIPEEQLKTWF